MNLSGTTEEKISDETDLDESCGFLMMPCLATVGGCLESKFHVV